MLTSYSNLSLVTIEVIQVIIHCYQHHQHNQYKLELSIGFQRVNYLATN